MMHQSEFDVANIALSRAADKRKSLINIHNNRYTATLKWLCRCGQACVKLRGWASSTKEFNLKCTNKPVQKISNEYRDVQHIYRLTKNTSSNNTGKQGARAQTRVTRQLTYLPMHPYISGCKIITISTN